MAGFRWFQVVPGWYQVVLAGFSWFQVVPYFSKYEGKTQFYLIRYKNGCLVVSDHFHIFTQSIKFYTFYYHVLMFEKYDLSNGQ